MYSKAGSTLFHALLKGKVQQEIPGP